MENLFIISTPNRGEQEVKIPKKRSESIDDNYLKQYSNSLTETTTS